MKRKELMPRWLLLVLLCYIAAAWLDGSTMDKLFG